MKFTETPLTGAFVIDLQERSDERGYFARAFCKEEFENQGLPVSVMQANASFNCHRGTLRGMHYQLPPRAETKIVRCIRGSLWDCIIDLRKNSPTFGKWFGIELSASNRRMLYVPKGFAHGFVTLEPDTEAFYFVDEFYGPEQERGVRWNDPQFGIEWPTEPLVISDKDKQHADFSDENAVLIDSANCGG